MIPRAILKKKRKEKVPYTDARWEIVPAEYMLPLTTATNSKPPTAHLTLVSFRGLAEVEQQVCDFSTYYFTGFLLRWAVDFKPEYQSYCNLGADYWLRGLMQRQRKGRALGSPNRAQVKIQMGIMSYLHYAVVWLRQAKYSYASVLS